MASIISSKVNKDHVVISFKVSFEEAKELNGHLANIHLIAEDNEGETATITEKGRKGCTKYFLIPKKLREDIQLKKEASCVRIDCKEKMLWVYIMDKL